MATRTKTTTSRPRRATAPKHAPETATTKAGDPSCVPGHTVSETKNESESAQRTAKRASVTDAAAGQSLGKPERIETATKATPNVPPSQSGPSRPIVLKSTPPAVTSTSSPMSKLERQDSRPAPEICQKFLIGQCKQKRCPYKHESIHYVPPEDLGQSPVKPAADPGAVDPPALPSIPSAVSTAKSLEPQTADARVEKPRKYRSWCRAVRYGGCHNKDCPHRHPRRWDPERTTVTSIVGSDCNEDEETSNNPIAEEEELKAPTPAPTNMTTQSAAALRASSSSDNKSPSSSSSTPSIIAPLARTNTTAGTSTEVSAGPRLATKTGEASNVSSDCDQLDRFVCRLYARGRCFYHPCRFRHVDPSRMCEAATQSEQQRQQSPAVDAADSVVTSLQPSSCSGESTASPSSADAKATRPSSTPSPLPPHVPAKPIVLTAPDLKAGRKAAEEPKGIGDPSTKGGAACHLVQVGQGTAADSKGMHELPKSSTARLTETVVPTKDNNNADVSPTQEMAGSLRLRETRDSSLGHLPSSGVADLGAAEATLPTPKVHSLPPKPSEPVPTLDSQSGRRQSVLGWRPDIRPARRFNYVCQQYRRGECPRGDGCHFVHTLARDDRKVAIRGEICYMYLLGACDWGNQCFRMHISPDSPTLSIPAWRSESSSQALSVSQACVGADDTNAIRSERLDEASASQAGDTAIRTPIADAEQVTHGTSSDLLRGQGVDMNLLGKKAELEVTSREESEANLQFCTQKAVVDNRPARRFSVICAAYLLGRCPFGEGCYKTHTNPQPAPSRGLLSEQIGLPTSRPPSSASFKVPPAQVPIETHVQRAICLNWLVRGDCLNGTACAYEHSTRGVLSLPPPAAEESLGSPTPMPIGRHNYGAYQQSQNRPSVSRSLRDDTAEPHTSYRRPVSPRPPVATVQPELSIIRSATTNCLLGILNRPSPGSQALTPSWQSDRTQKTSTWREPVMRDAQRNINHRLLDSSRLSSADSAYPNAPSMGRRIGWSHPGYQEVHPRAEQSRDIRDAVAFDRGENSSDSSFHSAEEFSDASNDTAPSSIQSPQRRPEVEIRADIKPHMRTVGDTRGPAIGPLVGAREEQRSSNASRFTPGAHARIVPLVPPGLGLEARDSGLAPPPVFARKEPPANMTFTVLDSTRVTYGPGFEVQSIITAFETRQVMLKDIPRGITNAEVSRALKSFGEITSVFLPDPGKKGVAGAKVTFATPEQAANAASALDGAELFGATLSARLWSGQTSLVGRARLTDGDVFLEFPCAHKTAYVGYSTRAQAERAISLANETELKGNWITAEIHEGLPSAGAVTVRFRGLPSSTQMKDLMRYGKAEGFVVERPNYESTKAAIHRLRVLLEKFGHDFLFNLLPPPYKRGNVRAYAHFETVEAAETVCAALHNRRQPFCGYGLLSATHVSTLVYQLPRTVFKALAYDIRLLNAFVWRTLEPGSGISIIDNRGPYAPVRIKLAARRYQALTKMKTLFDRLLHGERLEEGGAIVWDTFFARRAGALYLQDLEKRHLGVLINRDPSKGILSLFGPEPKRRVVRSAILAKVGDLRSRNWYSIDLPGRVIGLFWGSDLADLQQRFGEENVVLDTAARTLRVRGDETIHEAALLAVKQARERHADEKHKPQVECPVCFTEVTNPVKLDCGHTWCKGCLQNYLRASIDNASFPLVCLGGEASCSSRIPLHVAREVLSTNDYNDILEAAFRAHVHSHPKKYHYCPTPDCKQVYHRNTKCHVLQCPSCLLRICPKCNAEYHEHSPCQGDEASDRALFEEWKSSHDVKDCPGCKAPIEREAGCNHMTCVRCKTHICWVCLATFEESGEVYAHMRSIHGGIGLEEM